MAKRTCSINGCEGRLEARGWCQKHYKRWKKYGDPCGERVRANQGSCSIEDCARPAKTLGWCGAHYERYRRHGDPLATKQEIPRGTPIEQRLWGRAAVGADGCWRFTGIHDLLGYCRVRFKGATRMAHHVAYELAVGAIPDGLVLDHLCRVRDCINPAHLEAITQQENVLRGVGPTAVNARKTHCIHGHEFTAQNTIINSAGHRQCRTCDQRRRR